MKELISYYYNIDFSKVLIVDTKSCQNIETYATLRFLQKTTMKSEFAIFRDSDTGDRDKVKTKVLNKMRENLEAECLSIVASNIYVTDYSSIEGYFIDLELLISNKIFRDNEKMKEVLYNQLKRDKTNHIDYFKKNNKKDTDRITKFEEEYDSKIQEPIENIEWLKRNIRGHHLYGYLNASRLEFKKIIEESENSIGNDILIFLDNIEYFKQRRK